MRIKNIAVIPARKNSRGVKFKNRIFFNLTAQFVEKLRFIDKTIVTSDDKFILSKAKKKDFETHNRKKSFAKNNTSIKSTLANLIIEKKLNKKDILWLFYIPLINRNRKSFYDAYKITQKKILRAYVLL